MVTVYDKAFAGLSEDLIRSIDNLIQGFRNYGYVVEMEPVEGEAETYRNTLRDGLKKLDDTIEYYARTYNTRGRSKRALKMLHADQPEPIWGVRLDTLRK